MESRRLLDLLEYPICPVGDGNLVLFESPGTLRQVAFRGTPDPIVCISADQARSPALVTQRQVCLLRNRRRQFAFETERFGPALNISGLCPALLSTDLSDERGPAILALNTLRGAWLLEATDHGVMGITSKPLPYLLATYWEERGKATFGGSTLRAGEPGGDGDTEYAVGSPHILTVDRSHPARTVSIRSLADAVRLERWVSMAPPKLRDEPRFTKALDPEICLAGEAGQVVVAATGLYDWYDPLDTRHRWLYMSEMFVLIFGRLESGEVERVDTYTCAVASLRTGSGHHLYMGDNRGHGPPVASLQRVRLGTQPLSEPVSVTGLDPRLTCRSFTPCFHPGIGYFGTLRAGAPNQNDEPYFVHSDDGLTWTVVGDRTSVPTFAPD